MYWIYLTFFILAVLTPLIVNQGYFILPEEEAEGIIIMLLGMVSFFIYLAKEQKLFRLVSERLSLQKAANVIRRDLSDSYTYIAAMNRKQEIVKELLFELSEATAQDSDHCDLWYQKILETVASLSKSEAVSLRFVDTSKGTLLDHYEYGPSGNRLFVGFVPAVLLDQNRTFFEHQGCFVVRSPRASDHVVAFLAVIKQVNHFEDEEIFKMLVSEALVLYMLSRRVPLSLSSYAHRN